MNEKKTILPLLLNLKNHFRFTIGLILLLMLAVWTIFVFIVEPQHQVSSQLLIQDSAPTVPHLTGGNKQIDSQTVEAYAAFIRSPEVLEQVHAKLKLKNSISNLRNQVSVSSTSNSPVLTITVSSGSSRQAIELANTLAFTFQNEVRNSLKADNVTIISRASAPTENPNDNRLMFALLIAAVSGFVFSIFMGRGVNVLKTVANVKNKNIRKKEDQLQTVFK